MTVTLADISADCGEVYDAADGGTTAVTSLIARATAFAAGAGSSSDLIIRPLADAMLTNQVMGGIDSVNKTIGTLSVGAKELRSSRNWFMQEAKSAASILGISLDGIRIIFKDSEA